MIAPHPGASSLRSVTELANEIFHVLPGKAGDPGDAIPLCSGTVTSLAILHVRVLSRARSTFHWNLRGGQTRDVPCYIRQVLRSCDAIAVDEMLHAYVDARVVAKLYELFDDHPKMLTGNGRHGPIARADAADRVTGRTGVEYLGTVRQVRRSPHRRLELGSRFGHCH